MCRRQSSDQTDHQIYLLPIHFDISTSIIIAATIKYNYGALSVEVAAKYNTHQYMTTNPDEDEITNEAKPVSNGSCWPEFLAFKTPLDSPLNCKYYWSVRGVENILIYVWILKDLSWVQDWYIGLFFSCLGVILFGFLGIFSIYVRCFDEAWHYTASFLWLFGNTWWMSGELQDWYSKGGRLVYDERQKQAGDILLSAFVWVILYFAIIKPFKVFEKLGIPTQSTNPNHKLHFYDAGVEPRFPFFQTWRQYEQVHILFWIGKDFAWNTGDAPLWYACSICTFLIAIDFVWESSQQANMGIEFVHYLSILLWVTANIVWAGGELFDSTRDYPYDLFSR